MKVTVFGMGYVGCVTAACLADRGHEVTGVDVDDKKIGMIDDGRSPVLEFGLEDLIRRGTSSGHLRASTETADLGDVSLICVGTPSQDDGGIGLEQIKRVAAGIGKALRGTKSYHVVTVRSTVFPGTTETTVVPLLEQHSGKRCGSDFGICVNPEFMRESTAVEDFGKPAFTVIGTRDEQSAKRVEELYADVKAPIERMSIREAELVKYACNSFHALKICFANEIGNLSKRLGIDSHRIMDVLCRDTKLSLSSAYLKPGFAFGGSCLPKDLRALLHVAKEQRLEVPVLSSLLESNRRQIEAAVDLIRKSGKERIAVLGLSFKAGTDDLRESPVVLMVELLVRKGYRVTIHDEEVSLDKLIGANKRYIENTIPGIASLMADSIKQAVQNSEVVIVSKKNPAFRKELAGLAEDRMVIDLVRLFPEAGERPKNYEGICW